MKKIIILISLLFASNAFSETITFELTYDVIYDNCSVLETTYQEGAGTAVTYTYSKFIIVGSTVYGDEYLYKSDRVFISRRGDNTGYSYGTPTLLTKEKRKAYKILGTMRSEGICNKIEVL